MLKNIVFDLGGVLVDYDPREYLSERFLNKPLEDFLFERIFASHTWRELDAGRITLARATELILADCAGRRYEGQMVLDDWRDMLVTRKSVVRLAEELKSCGATLYYLSDISEDVLGMFRQKKRFMQLFDGGVASCEEKLLKPDPKIFGRLIDRFELNPAETIFIDDRRENVETAQSLGMTAILFRDAKDLRATLQFLGFPLKTTNARRAHLHAVRGDKKKATKKPEVKAVINLRQQDDDPPKVPETDIPL